MKRSILITGGAGYIGSHICYEFLEYFNKNGIEDLELIIIDNLVNSDLDNLEKIKEKFGIYLKIYSFDVCDIFKLENVFSENDIVGVIHLAGLKAVGESNEMPLEYYSNNLLSTLNLLKVMEKYNVNNLIFSSSATVYGVPQYIPLLEDHPVSALNPYGRTKLMIEQILMDYNKSKKDFQTIILRYFNPISCHPSGLLKENPKGKPNNIFPLISRVYQNILPEISIFGNDYKETEDGTGVRDYIHVVDLADAHIKSMMYLIDNKREIFKIYNVGTGRGYSVLELIDAFKRIGKRDIAYKFVERREGDVAICLANCDLIKRELGWETKYNLDDMVQHEVDRLL